ncbi:hypothetical protein Tco_1227036 [Tanacetum coccineum]
MESEKYLEGQSMQRPPLFESDGFIYWKNRFETYVKSKDLDLWHVITDGDFPPIQNNPKTKKDEVVPFHKQNDDLKKKLAKNNEAKMNMPPREDLRRNLLGSSRKAFFVGQSIEKYKKTRAGLKKYWWIRYQQNTGGKSCLPESTGQRESYDWTTEYCPATEIKDGEPPDALDSDSEGGMILKLTKSFSTKLALMCHELVATRKEED